MLQYPDIRKPVYHSIELKRFVDKFPMRKQHLNLNTLWCNAMHCNSENEECLLFSFKFVQFYTFYPPLSFCLFACFVACLTSDHQTLQSYQGQTCHQDTVINFCSELLIRLSYCIYLRYGISCYLTWESNPGTSDRELFTLPLEQSAILGCNALNYVSMYESCFIQRWSTCTNHDSYNVQSQRSTKRDS